MSGIAIDPGSIAGRAPEADASGVKRSGRSRARTAAATKPRARSLAAVAVVGIFMVLRRGAAYVGFPPLYGGEIAILVFAALFLRLRTLRGFLRTGWGWAALTFAALVVPHLLIPARETPLKEFGLYAAVLYYAVFIYFGYAAVHTRVEQRWFLELLYYVMVAGAAHNLLNNVLPLASLSPWVNGVSLLGQTDASAVGTVIGLAYLVLFAPRLGWLRSGVLLAVWLAGSLSSGCRIVVVCLAGMAALLWWGRRLWGSRVKKYLAGFAVAAVCCLATLELFHAGAVTEKLRHQFALARATVGHAPSLPGKAGSKAHRLAMWDQIVEETLREDPWFGQGFGGPLVDVGFRNPHNGFVNIFGRTGVVGFALAAALYLAFPVAVAWRLRRARGETARELFFYLCYAMVIVLVALTGPTLTAPYSLLACNFIYGAFLRRWELARGEQGGVGQLRTGQGSPSNAWLHPSQVKGKRPCAS